jgi:hypothetical protein
METVDFIQPVQVPSVEDFLADYPRFTALATGPARPLFTALFQPHNVIRAQVVAELGYPSVLAVADQCQRYARDVGDIHLDNFTKQAVGAAMCTLMEANGFKKTKKKRSVPHEAFVTGEVYERDYCLTAEL